jgi:hypothetical protein
MILVALDVKDNFFTGVGFSNIKKQRGSREKPNLIYMDSDFTEAHGNTNSVSSSFLYIYLFVISIPIVYQKINNYHKGFFFSLSY